jgi:hypothetical protein
MRTIVVYADREAGTPVKGPHHAPFIAETRNTVKPSVASRGARRTPKKARCRRGITAADQLLLNGSFGMAPRCKA